MHGYAVVCGNNFPVVSCVTLDERIEHAATAFETIEEARWRSYELFAEIANECPLKSRERGARIRAIADRVGRGARVVSLWVRAVGVVPEELRHPFLPIMTCLWCAENLAPEEAGKWLTRCHDEGLSLRQLQIELGVAQDAATVVSLRRILRSIARDAPDEPLDPAEAGEIERALRDVIQAGGTPVCGV